ncbi:MAG TPA: sigma factor, partial [Dehalococcoidia bacterium]|nr:sigma factor [Dehalococcoidia bacterium]
MESSAASRAEYVETQRPRLTGLAYRMLGSVTEAQDLVQDVAVRFLATDPGAISKPEQYLTSMTARACIDYLRSATRRREVYVGPWLPEPVRTEGADASD